MSQFQSEFQRGVGGDDLPPPTSDPSFLPGSEVLSHESFATHKPNKIKGFTQKRLVLVLFRKQQVSGSNPLVGSSEYMSRSTCIVDGILTARLAITEAP